MKMLVTWKDVQHIVDFDQRVQILYRNWRSETSWRRIVPLPVPPQFGSDYHPGQWILHAYDLDRKQVRSFALPSILRWLDKDGAVPAYQLAQQRPPRSGYEQLDEEVW